MEISRIVWLEDIVEKLIWKHGIEEHEVIEVFESKYPPAEAGALVREPLEAAHQGR